jgi:hypothetical protein
VCDCVCVCVCVWCIELKISLSFAVVNAPGTCEPCFWWADRYFERDPFCETQIVMEIESSWLGSPFMTGIFCLTIVLC